MRSHHRLVLYPLLFGLMPPLTLLSMNIESIAPVYVVRPVLVITAGVILAYLLASRILRDRRRAAASVALLILLLSHSLVRESIARVAYWDPAGVLAMCAELLWAAGMLLGICLVAFRKHLPAELESSMAVIGLGLLVVPIFQILVHEQLLKKPFELPGGSGQEAAQTIRVESLPDIYYIILDGYGRQDILLELYRLDNSAFLSELEKRGFYVADRSQSNYSQTALSLASSLNMTDLSALAKMQGEDSGDQRPITRMIRHSVVRSILESQGYAIESLSTGYRRTEIEDASVFLRPPIRAVNGFETLVMESMGLTPVVRGLVALGVLAELPGYQDQRDRVLFAFSGLQGEAGNSTPRFVFAHIVVPHPPFLWDAAGRPVSPGDLFQWDDGSNFPGGQEEYVAGYRAQIQYVNRLVLEAVDRIRADPERQQIILLQADHGPGSRLDWDHPERTNLPERMSILNAYYAPLARPDLYPGISPVNSFRILFNRYFGLDLELLPDQSYFSTWDRPFDFIPVPANKPPPGELP